MSRDRVMSVRLTKSEFEQFRREREGRLVSDIARDRLLSPAHPSPPLIPSVPSESITVPAQANVIWLTPRHVEGNTLTFCTP